MATKNEYLFVEQWAVPGHTPAEVYAVLSQAMLLPEWWKDVYLEATPLDGDDVRVGARAKVKARGFLPYTLTFLLTATALEPDRLVETKAEGDFDGVWRAEITPSPNGSIVNITWRTIVNKPLVKLLSPVLRPLFRKNHDWTTIRGEAGIRDYLAQRVGTSPSR